MYSQYLHQVAYPKTIHGGHASSVSIGDGKVYKRGELIIPSWRGQWKDKSRDKEIIINQNITFLWNQIGDWFYIYMDI